MSEKAAAARSAAPVIHARQVFTIESATAALGLKRGTIPREARLRRLRVAKRAGKVFILGSWLLAWIETGEVCRKGGNDQAAAERG